VFQDYTRIGLDVAINTKKYSCLRYGSQ